MKKRGPKPQFTLDDVLDAASDIIGDQGYPALSMSAVARTMGTSVSGLYRYVEGLEPLLVALQTRAIAGYCTGLTERLASFDEVNRNRKPTKKAALERVILTFGYYAEHARTFPTRHRSLSAFLSAPTPVLSEASAREVDTTLGSVINLGVACLREARACGALREGDDEQRTYQLWAAMHGLDHFEKRDRILPPSLQSAELRAQMLQDLLVGFGAPRGLMTELGRSSM